jgi:HK97 gp10 family phage protein
MIDIKLQGLDGLHAQLVEIGGNLAIKTLAKAARKAFKPVLEAAKRMAPRDSGALADSLRISVVKKGDGVAVGIVIGKAVGKPGELPPKRRWHWIEFGTAKQQPHPFLRPALAANASAVLDALAIELRAGIQDALGAG